jgi:hypothetical protein
MNEVNVYWSPNIPTSSSEINVTVYGHMLYGDGIDNVSLGVRIGASSWNNYTITGNVHNSEEGDLESYSYLIPAQADGTNITVQASIRNGTTWHVGMEMVIRVRNSIGSLPTTTTTTGTTTTGTTTTGTTTTGTTTTTTTTTDPLTQFLIEWGVYIAAGIAAVILGIVFTRRK